MSPGEETVVAIEVRVRHTTNMMPNSLIPLRFMVLMGHFVIIVVMLWSREEIVNVCVDWDEPETLVQQTQSKDIELTTAFSLSVACVSIELLCFLTGISMFYPLHSFLCFLCHAFACIGLGMFVIDGWECGLVWWLFALFTLIPALAEVVLISSILFFKKPF